jgi:hypothetical protein
MSVLKARGRFKVNTDDGVCTWTYDGPEFRICHQPAVAGASMPRIVEVWETATAGSMIKVFAVFWFQDGNRFEVVAHRPGPWHDILFLAANPPTVSEGTGHTVGTHPARSGVGG